MYNIALVETYRITCCPGHVNSCGVWYRVLTWLHFKVTLLIIGVLVNLVIVSVKKRYWSVFSWKLTNVEFYTVSNEKIECNVTASATVTSWAKLESFISHEFFVQISCCKIWLLNLESNWCHGKEFSNMKYRKTDKCPFWICSKTEWRLETCTVFGCQVCLFTSCTRLYLYPFGSSCDWGEPKGYWKGLWAEEIIKLSYWEI